MLQRTVQSETQMRELLFHASPWALSMSQITLITSIFYYRLGISMGDRLVPADFSLHSFKDRAAGDTKVSTTGIKKEK